MPHSTGTHTATIDGQQVNVASLETIDLGRLEANEPAEVEKLLNASQMPGFFYLNFGDYMTKKFLEDLPTIYAAAEEYFDKPEDEKKNDIRDGQDRGWDYSLDLL